MAFSNNEKTVIFRVPKIKTSMNYEQEIKKIVDEMRLHFPRPQEESSKKKQTVVHYKHFFEDDSVHFRLEFKCNQVFLGSQEIAMRTHNDRNAFFVVDSNPRFTLAFARLSIDIPMSEVLAFSIYKTTLIGIQNVLILNLTSRGSNCVIEKFQSVKYRLDKFQNELMPELYFSMHRSTLILTLANRDNSAKMPSAILRSLSDNETAFKLLEKDWVKAFSFMKKKLEKNNSSIQFIFDKLEEVEMEDIMDTLGLSWLKIGTTFQLKDRCHMLGMTPTLFMESTSHGICELNPPDHSTSPLARKRMLSFSDDLEMEESDPKVTLASDDESFRKNNRSSSEQSFSLSENTPNKGDSSQNASVYSEELPYTVSYVECDRPSAGISILAALIAEDMPSTSSSSYVQSQPTYCQ